MEPLRFLIVSPYSSLNDLITELLTQYPNVSADCYVSNLYDTRNLIPTLNLNNYDAVISRGGTAGVLREIMPLPVFDIGVSALDALRAVRLAGRFPARAACVAFENICCTMRMLDEILDFSIPTFPIATTEEADVLLEKLRQEGYAVIICDVIASQLCRHHNLSPVLVTSGYETVRNTLDQAVSIMERTVSGRSMMPHLQTAFAGSPSSCTIFDASGNMLLSSLSQHDPDQILPYLEGNRGALLTGPAETVEKDFRGRVLKITRTPVRMREASYIYIYTHISNRAKIKRISAISQISGTSLKQTDLSYYNSSHNIGTTQPLIEKYARDSAPVIIIGETGTGKDRAAYMLHSLGELSSGICHRIDCAGMAPKDWTFLLSHPDSPLFHSRNTLYFRHLDTVPNDVFQQLVETLTTSGAAQRSRLIVSLVITQDSPNQKQYLAELTHRLHGLTLYLPSLRERTEDIPLLATIYINRLNAQLGKQIIGFDEKAAHALTRFPWQSNLDQFQRIIRELMLLTTTSYISYENTMRILRQETATWMPAQTAHYQLDLHQPLDAINADIALLILRQEDGNHTRTAARLGISRSTLWRLLKPHGTTKSV